MFVTDVSIQLIDKTDKEKGYDWSARQKLPWFKNSYLIAGTVSFVAIASLLSHLYVIQYFISTKNTSTPIFAANQKRKTTPKNVYSFLQLSLF
uniref:Uncharacterized protein n=1 Tax=Panagrolaimus superbus TaxID=310955 RepID=A0A914YBQ1_9BILA